MGFYPAEKLTPQEFQFVLDNLPANFLSYYFNKYRYCTTHTGLQTIYYSSDIFLGLRRDLSEEAIRTLIELNEKAGRHVDFRERWTMLHDEFQRQLETSDDIRDLIKPYWEGFCSWINQTESVRCDLREDLSQIGRIEF